MIGVLDSGVGGLSVLRSIHQVFPHIPTLYFADQKHVPYGVRPRHEIDSFVKSITDFLLSQGAQVIVVACHAASSASLYALRQAYPHIPFVGMEPAVKPAVNASQRGVIGVLTTQATADGLLYQQVLERFAKNVRVITQVAPGLVELVEQGRDDEDVIRSYVDPLADADQIVLACTHFPFLHEAIERVIGQHASIVDPSDAVARQVGRVLPSKQVMQSAQSRYFTSGDVSHYRYLIKRLIGLDVEPEQVILNVRT